MLASSSLDLLLPPMLATALMQAPLFAFEPCVATSGDTLRCGAHEIRVNGVRAHAPGTEAGEAARTALQSRVRSNTIRLRARSRDGTGRIVADVYVGGTGYSAGGSLTRQHHVGPRPVVLRKGCATPSDPRIDDDFFGVKLNGKRLRARARC